MKETINIDPYYMLKQVKKLGDNGIGALFIILTPTGESSSNVSKITNASDDYSNRLLLEAGVYNWLEKLSPENFSEAQAFLNDIQNFCFKRLGSNNMNKRA